ncbi:MAG: M48 family metallopeptidase [Opitutaceae bacterium]|jgi:Zn-dependent protease with chaperone function|nr:M48 family metallopeptidase [Opitutaceae bacterium]
MDFFEAQAQSQKRTGRLIVLFGFAVVGTVLAGYGAALLIQGGLRHSGTNNGNMGPLLGPIWQPKLFYTLTGLTLGLIGISALTKWISFREGGSAVARMLGGQKVHPGTKDLAERQLLNVVEEMAIASGTPVPATFILPDDKSINAFAAGLNTHDAAVAVTRGTLDVMSRDELQAIIGHEFSHILNGDMRLNLRLASIVFGILFIGLIGQGMIRGMSRMRIRNSRGSKKGGGGVLIYLAIAAATTIVGYMGYFFGRLIQSAVSRQREFLADASAVQFTRNPDAMSGVLKKIGGQHESPELASPKAGQINHCFFSQAFVSRLSGLATHPPLDARIRAIDPNFDGQFTRPKPAPPRPPELPKKAAPIPGNIQDLLTPSIDRLLDPAGLLATIGVLDASGIDHAQKLLAQIGDEFREAAQSAKQAEPLVYAMLLDTNPEVRAQQLALLDSNTATTAASYFEKLRGQPVEVRLPLIQLTLVGLRELDTAGQAHLKLRMKQLAESDGEINSFEYALQRVISHGLEVANSPSKNLGSKIYSFGAVGHSTSILLSALAHAGTTNSENAAAAFESSRAQIPLMKSVVLKFVKTEDIDLEKLDGALNQLATAAPPIKERIIAAACAVIVHDGSALISELELLRATCAALDVPMPPIARGARDGAK